MFCPFCVCALYVLRRLVHYPKSLSKVCQLLPSTLLSSTPLSLVSLSLVPLSLVLLSLVPLSLVPLSLATLVNRCTHQGARSGTEAKSVRLEVDAIRFVKKPSLQIRGCKLEVAN